MEEVKGRSLHQHWEQNSKFKATAVHPKKASLPAGTVRAWRFYQICLFAFSMRKLEAHSSVPKGSASHKKRTPSSCVRGSRTATLPMVLMFLPHPWGEEGPGSTVRSRDPEAESVWRPVGETGKRETSASHLYGKFLRDQDGFPQTEPTASSEAFSL